MYTESDFSWIFFISGLISFIFFVVIFVKIIQISKEVKKISTKTNSSFKLREKAILELQKGNKKEAKELIENAFVLDCMYVIESYYRESDVRDKQIWFNIYEYSRYGNIIPEFTQEYFITKSKDHVMLYIAK